MQQSIFPTELSAIPLLGIESEQLQSQFAEYFDTNPVIQEAYPIARQNSSGKIYLIGSRVYRRLVEIVHNVELDPRFNGDVDFAVSYRKRRLSIPTGWTTETNYHEGPRLKGPDFKIDIVQLKEFDSIADRGLKATIENYLTGVSTTIQAVAYDPEKRKLYCELALSDIELGIIRPNCLDKFLQYNGDAGSEPPGFNLALRLKHSLGFRSALPMWVFEWPGKGWTGPRSASFPPFDEKKYEFSDCYGRPKSVKTSSDSSALQIHPTFQCCSAALS